MILSEFDDIDVGRKVLIAFVIMLLKLKRIVSVCAYFGFFLDGCYSVTLYLDFVLIL